MVTARDPFGMSRVCRCCGCTEHNACTVRTPAGLAGCSWVLVDIDTPTGICSACAIKLRWDQQAFHFIGFADEAGEEPDPPRLLVAS